MSVTLHSFVRAQDTLVQKATSQGYPEVRVIHSGVPVDGLLRWHHQPRPDLHLKHLDGLNLERMSGIKTPEC